MRAFSLLRDDPFYRRRAFDEGLRRAGFEVLKTVVEPRPGDVLLIWNRYGHWHETARRFEAAGGMVLVAENGYLGRGGVSPKFDVHPAGPKPESYYSLSVGWHNGRGIWPRGGPERLNAIGVELKPWRTSGEHVLVCPNRPFGVGEQLMPASWAEDTAAALRRLPALDLPVRIRQHPGNNAPARSLAEDLRAAWSVVIWSSSSGVHALVEGIPVVCMAPYWVCKKEASYDELDFVLTEKPEFDLDREAALQRMAWHQWTIEEVASGEPFRLCLSAAREAQVAPAV